MKSTGIVRKVDELGRIVIPIELRRTMQIGEKDSLEIYVDGSTVMLKKYQPACHFTNEMDELITYQGTKVSKKAILEMASIVGILSNPSESSTSETNTSESSQI